MNKYEILGTIGSGSYGVVLRCRHKQTKEVVAIKKFKETDEDEIVRKTTKREVKILRLLKHDNIVSLREAFRTRGKLFLVFEFVDHTLLERLEEPGAGPSPELVRRWLYQLTSALFFCHAANIVHRDIKPENLLVTAGDDLKLCDFGFARSVVTRSAITRYVATRWYRAPELLVGGASYGKPVDVWALGCILAEMYTRKPLFAGDSDLDQLHLIEHIIGPISPEQRAALQVNISGARSPARGRVEPLPPPPAAAAAAAAGGGAAVPSLSPLRRRLQMHLPALALDMLESMLSMEPSARPTCEQLLEHAFFAPLHDAQAKADMQARAQLLVVSQQQQPPPQQASRTGSGANAAAAKRGDKANAAAAAPPVLLHKSASLPTPAQAGAAAAMVGADANASGAKLVTERSEGALAGMLFLPNINTKIAGKNPPQLPQQSLSVVGSLPQTSEKLP